MHFLNRMAENDFRRFFQHAVGVGIQMISEMCIRDSYYTVANKNEQFGFLLFEKGCLQMQENGNMQTALEYASIVLILHIQVQIANQQMAEKYKASFLEDLLTNNVKTDVEIHNRARLYGWDFTNGGLAAVVDINNIKKYFTDHLDSKDVYKRQWVIRII